MHDPRDAGRAEGNQGGRDCVAAVVRDPRTVFLHWELTGPCSALAVKVLGPGCRWCVRVLNMADGSSSTVPVDPQARRHYVEATPGTTCAFELAATDGERWRPVCRTERVDMPPAEPEVAARRRGPEAGRRPALVEVAGLRFETTAVHLGSSSRTRPSAQQASAAAAQRVA